MKIKSTAFVKSATKSEHYPDWSLPEVAFAGRSNVGKSSLMNILLRRKSLVKVSKTPGRTQLLNFFTALISSDREIGLVDLPGYGFAKVPKSVKRKWGKMIEGYLGGRRNLKALVIIMDIRRGMEADDRQLLEAMAHFGVQPILVFTKADKLSRNKATTKMRKLSESLQIPSKEFVLFSSHTGKGREQLWKRIEEVCLPRKNTSNREVHEA